MNKVALIYGGFSGEAEVSKRSAQEIFKVLKTDNQQPYLVRITGQKWVVELDDSEFEINKNDFSFHYKNEIVNFDSVFNIIHGTPGEDGKLSGYFELIGVPYNSSGVVESALTFNKNWCNKFLSTFGVSVPQSVIFYKEENNDLLREEVKFPCFVKPNNGGSSIGVRKANDISELDDALKTAFVHDNEVIVEEFIEGREFSCGILKNKTGIKVMPLTEIIVNAEFFDYEQKYSADGATEITPADITSEESIQCQKIVKKVFNILRLKKVARIDFILKNGIFYLIEVNTIPGMSPQSILPQQAEHLGISFQSLVNDYLL
jgi:D-alanine-D-alanine ligase